MTGDAARLCHPVRGFGNLIQIRDVLASDDCSYVAWEIVQKERLEKSLWIRVKLTKFAQESCWLHVTDACN